MTTLRRLWITDAPLTFTGLLMIGALATTLAGLWFDPVGVRRWVTLMSVDAHWQRPLKPSSMSRATSGCLSPSIQALLAARS